MSTESRAIIIVPDDATKINRSDFAADFVFGAGTSALQIEGGWNEGGRGPSIWDAYTHTRPDKVMDGSNADMAVDSYHLYKEDVKILKNLGLDAYRFSISWSRLLPGGRLNAGVNKEGINYYNNLIDELLANGIRPFVTLFHWDLPQALEDEYGGFLSRRVVNDFLEYVELCFWEFGDRVKHWITLNEPWTFCVSGYVNGITPPGRGPTLDEHLSHPTLPHKHFATIARCSNGNPGIEPYFVAHHLLLAHAAAVELYKSKFQKGQEGQIGITLNAQWLEPLDESSNSDVKAAIRALDFMFGWFMEPITAGDYPNCMKERVASRLPKFSPQESEKLKGSYDFLGLNYYTASYVTDASTNTSGSNDLSYNTDIQVTYSSERNGVLIGPKAGSDWLCIYPKGIRKLLVYIKKTYNDPLIYITENGVDEVNNTSLTVSEARADKFRIQYIQDHLFNIQLAIRNDDVNVKGYFVWSLLDNFEGCCGYTFRFGIIHVNYNNNFARYPKESAIWLMNSFHKKNSKVPRDPKESAIWPFKRMIEEDEEQIPKKKLRN